MAGMRTLEKEFRLQADSVQDIAGEFALLAAKIGQELKFGRRRMQAGPLLNAIVLRFLRMPEPERQRFAVSAIKELEVFLAEASHVPPAAAEGLLPAEVVRETDVPEPKRAKPKRGRSKKNAPRKDEGAEGSGVPVRRK